MEYPILDKRNKNASMKAQIYCELYTMYQESASWDEFMMKRAIAGPQHVYYHGVLSHGRWTMGWKIFDDFWMFYLYKSGIFRQCCIWGGIVLLAVGIIIQVLCSIIFSFSANTNVLFDLCLFIAEIAYCFGAWHASNAVDYIRYASWK